MPVWARSAFGHVLSCLALYLLPDTTNTPYGVFVRVPPSSVAPQRPNATERAQTGTFCRVRPLWSDGGGKDTKEHAIRRVRSCLVAWKRPDTTNAPIWARSLVSGRCEATEQGRTRTNTPSGVFVRVRVQETG